MIAMQRALRGIALTGTWLGGILGCAVLLLPSTALADCTSDSDCRAGRVCHNGVCEYPACAKDVDCAGNQICERGSCVASSAGEPTPSGPGPAPSAPAPAALPGPMAPTLAPAVDQGPVRFGAEPSSTGGNVPAEGGTVTDVPPTTKRYSTALLGWGIPVAVVGAGGLVAGIPVALTATDTLDVSSCGSVDIVNTTQRNAGIAVAVAGGVMFVVGMVMILVGSHKVEVEPASEPAGLSSGERDVYVPELATAPVIALPSGQSTFIVPGSHATQPIATVCTLKKPIFCVGTERCLGLQECAAQAGGFGPCVCVEGSKTPAAGAPTDPGRIPEGLFAGEPQVRAQGVIEVVKQKQMIALEKLKAIASGDADEGVRRIACWALGEIGGASEIYVLKTVSAKDASAVVKNEAAVALTRLEGHSGAPPTH